MYGGMHNNLHVWVEHYPVTLITSWLFQSDRKVCTQMITKDL